VGPILDAVSSCRPVVFNTVDNQVGKLKFVGLNID